MFFVYLGNGHDLYGNINDLCIKLRCLCSIKIFIRTHDYHIHSLLNNYVYFILTTLVCQLLSKNRYLIVPVLYPLSYLNFLLHYH